jgi:hypothetical protein
MTNRNLFPSDDKVECIGSLLVHTKDLEEFSSLLHQAQIRREQTAVTRRSTIAPTVGSLLVTPDDSFSRQAAGPAKLQKWITQQLPRRPHNE